MAITGSQRSALKAGQRILVEGFTATVRSRSDINGAVSLSDDNGINTHYLAPARLSKTRPFRNGRVYRDDNGELFQYKSASEFAEGTWLSYTLEDGADENDGFDYDYPVRPLREFTVNPVISE